MDRNANPGTLTPSADFPPPACQQLTCEPSTFTCDSNPQPAVSCARPLVKLIQLQANFRRCLHQDTIYQNNGAIRLQWSLSASEARVGRSLSTLEEESWNRGWVKSSLPAKPSTPDCVLEPRGRHLGTPAVQPCTRDEGAASFSERSRLSHRLANANTPSSLTLAPKVVRLPVSRHDPVQTRLGLGRSCPATSSNGQKGGSAPARRRLKRTRESFGERSCLHAL